MPLRTWAGLALSQLLESLNSMGHLIPKARLKASKQNAPSWSSATEGGAKPAQFLAALLQACQWESALQLYTWHPLWEETSDCN